MARRYEFSPRKVDVDLGDDGIAVLTFSTAREDIALTLEFRCLSASARTNRARAI